MTEGRAGRQHRAWTRSRGRERARGLVRRNTLLLMGSQAALLGAGAVWFTLAVVAASGSDRPGALRRRLPRHVQPLRRRQRAARRAADGHPRSAGVRPRARVRAPRDRRCSGRSRRLGGVDLGPVPGRHGLRRGLRAPRCSVASRPPTCTRPSPTRACRRRRGLRRHVWARSGGAPLVAGIDVPGSELLAWVTIPFFAIARRHLHPQAAGPDPLELAYVEAEEDDEPARAAAAASCSRSGHCARPSRRHRVAQTAMVAVMGVTPVALDDYGVGAAAIAIVISLHIAGMYALGPVIGAAARPVRQAARAARPAQPYPRQVQSPAPSPSEIVADRGRHVPRRASAGRSATWARRPSSAT